MTTTFRWPAEPAPREQAWADRCGEAAMAEHVRAACDATARDALRPRCGCGFPGCSGDCGEENDHG